MLHRKNFKAVLLLIAAGCFISSNLNAQLTVLPNGNVGIGNPAPVQKLDVVVNAADPAQEAGRFANNSTTALPKYGIRNTVSNAGTSTRYGIYNDVQTLSTSGAFSYGMFNTVTPGTGGAYGMYNANNSGGGGYRYGFYNYTNRTGATANTSLGIYNYTSNTLGTTYGLYNYTTISGASTSANYSQYNYQYSAGTATHYGIYNYVTTAAATTAGIRYGIWTEVNNSGAGVRYGIYSRSLGATNFAGYFDGNVHVQGTFTNVSDDKLKVNISSVDNALAIIQQLDAKTYDFRVDIKGLILPEGHQIGLLASQVEKAAPMLVKEIKTPVAIEISGPLSPEIAAKSGDGNPVPTQNQKEDMYSYKAVNYIGLIPVLVQAIKEQQQMIENLQKQLQEQKALISRLKPAVK
jgi:hypothetical protein